MQAGYPFLSSVINQSKIMYSSFLQICALPEPKFKCLLGKDRKSSEKTAVRADPLSSEAERVLFPLTGLKSKLGVTDFTFYLVGIHVFVVAAYT